MVVICGRWRYTSVSMHRSATCKPVKGRRTKQRTKTSLKAYVQRMKRGNILYMFNNIKFDSLVTADSKTILILLYSICYFT
jgi:hypothetical protein